MTTRDLELAQLNMNDVVRDAYNDGRRASDDVARRAYNGGADLERFDMIPLFYERGPLRSQRIVYRGYSGGPVGVLVASADLNMN